MCAIGVRADRYAVDFLAAPRAREVVAPFGRDRLAAGQGPRALGGGVSAILTAFAAAFGFFGGLQEFEAFKDIRIPAYQAMEWAGNFPSHWLQRLGLLRSGPVELKVLFPSKVSQLTSEPLLAAGTPEYSDTLYAVEWPGGRMIELLADHSGYGGPALRADPDHTRARSTRSRSIRARSTRLSATRTFPGTRPCRPAR